MNELEAFVKMSRMAGERLDLVQAGGGNSSVKLTNDLMLIKASGGLLSEVDSNTGFIEVSLSRVISFFEKIQLEKDQFSKSELDNQIEKFIKSLVDTKGNRPSIETFLHSILHKYTLHVHPMVFTHILSRKNAKEIIGKLFPAALFIDYYTPGFEISYKLHEAIKNFKKLEIPNLIFLKNHGVIFSDTSSDKIQQLCSETIAKAERYLNLNLSSNYVVCNKISQAIRDLGQTDFITYFSTDLFLKNLIIKNRDLFRATPTTPDDLVYNGVSPLFINSENEILNCIKKNSEPPKVLILKDEIYFVAKTLKKAKEMEEVFKSHIFALSVTENLNDYDFLNNHELEYLANWEAEKYRQKK